MQLARRVWCVELRHVSVLIASKTEGVGEGGWGRGDRSETEGGGGGTIAGSRLL